MVKQDAQISLKIDSQTLELVKAIAKENKMKTSKAIRELLAVGLNQILKPKK